MLSSVVGSNPTTEAVAKMLRISGTPSKARQANDTPWDCVESVTIMLEKAFMKATLDDSQSGSDETSDETSDKPSSQRTH